MTNALLIPSTKATFAPAKAEGLRPIKSDERTMLEIKVANTVPIRARLID